MSGLLTGSSLVGARATRAGLRGVRRGTHATLKYLLSRYARQPAPFSAVAELDRFNARPRRKVPGGHGAGHWPARVRRPRRAGSWPVPSTYEDARWFQPQLWQTSTTYTWNSEYSAAISSSSLPRLTLPS